MPAMAYIYLLPAIINDSFYGFGLGHNRTNTSRSNKM